MDSLIIQRTEETPFVHLDQAGNFFQISGNSYPEDPTDFYKPVIRWLQEYTLSPNSKTDFIFYFVYFNSASYKSLYEIVHLLEKIIKQNGVVKIIWQYKEGDVDVREIGEELAEAVKIPFEIIPVL